MNVKQLAHLNDWTRAGDIGPCDIDFCIETPCKFAEVKQRDATDTWYLCKKHFAEYLIITDRLRDEARKP